MINYLGYCGPQSTEQQLGQQPMSKGLCPAANLPVTCSLVVLPVITK